MFCIMQWLQTPSKDSSLGSFDDFRDSVWGGGLAPPQAPRKLRLYDYTKPAPADNTQLGLYVHIVSQHNTPSPLYGDVYVSGTLMTDDSRCHCEFCQTLLSVITDELF